MFASSREGEEATLLAAIRARGDVAAVQWLVVSCRATRSVLTKWPRWCRHRASACRGAAPGVTRRRPADVWLGDSLGEMALYYGLSDVALLGGSFAPLGGQNLIEAAACGCPVVMGPHTFNFADAADLAAQAGAAFRVGDEAAAVEVALGLAAAGAQHDAATAATQAFAVAHRGAVQHTADAVLALAGPVAKR
jgi:3-deoxy-D-manno-octulosonic-acid transferase